MLPLQFLDRLEHLSERLAERADFPRPIGVGRSRPWSKTALLTWADVRDGAVHFRPESRKRVLARKAFPLPASLAAALEALRRFRSAFLGRVPHGQDFVFFCPQGAPWAAQKPGRALRLLRRMLRAAGIARVDATGRSVDIHALRGTAATRLLRQGVSESAVAQLLGASVEVILRHYARPTRDDLQDAVDRLPDLGTGTQCLSQPDMPIAADIADHTQLATTG